MRESVERELKLVPGEGFVMPQLGSPLPTRVFVSTYHDSLDLRLARHGITFRHRVEEGAGLWQLKLPHGAHRIELEQAGPPARPPLELTSLLVGHLRGRPLVPVARLRTRREGVRALGAEIVEDNVTVLDGVHVARRFRELEVELVEGDEETLRRLGRELRRAGARERPLRSKLLQALDLAEPPPPVTIARGAAPREAVTLALAEQLRRMLAHDPGTRLGHDPEDLHQLRVATRRARAILRAARPLVDRAWADGLRAELGWLGAALGPARDADVLLGAMLAEVAALGDDAGAAAGLLAQLELERSERRGPALEALSGDRYLALLEALETVVSGTVPGTGTSTLTSVWTSALRRSRRAADAIGAEPSDDELHAFRIAVKRLRYATELAAHELGRTRADAVVQAAKTLQDTLGEHQDAVVAEDRVRAWAAGDAAGRLAAGRLVERARYRRARTRAEWRGQWRRLERRSRRLAR